MQIDPVQEWQRLTAEYREKSEGELLELARDYRRSDRTRAAGAARRDAQPRIGRSGDSETRGASRSRKRLHLRSRRADRRHRIRRCSRHCIRAARSHARAGATTLPISPNRNCNGPHEYTWKTPLCECETNDEARQLSQRCGRQASIVGSQQAREFGRQQSRASWSLPINSIRRSAIAAQTDSAGDRRGRKGGSSGVCRAQVSQVRVGGRGSRRRRSRKHLALRAMRRAMDRNLAGKSRRKAQRPKKGPHKRKEPPGNGAALPSGRIVPTEANPSELSGCILGSGESSVKRKYV